MANKFREKGKYNNFYGNFEIGEGTSLGSFCDVGGKIGKNCSIQSYVFIPEGVTIEDDCFIGPGVTFTNDKNPPSHRKDWKPIVVKRGAIIGARVTVLPDVEIGEGAFIGAGSLVTHSVPAGEMWYGSPARMVVGKVKTNENNCNGGIGVCGETHTCCPEK